jgi:hypothetical protein
LIRLIAKGGDGLEELDIICSTSPPSISYPWYYDVGEVFDAVLQVLQVCND